MHLCQQIVPFPMFELQSKWIAGVLSNRIALPSKEEMVEDIQAFYSSLEASGTPKRHTHNMALLQVPFLTFFPAIAFYLRYLNLSLRKLSSYNINHFLKFFWSFPFMISYFF